MVNQGDAERPGRVDTFELALRPRARAQVAVNKGGLYRGVIVNADDFGRSAGVNRGIASAFERGIVTSASLMVRWPAAEAAARYARADPGLSVGLHVDLGEWARVTGHQWRMVYEVVALDDEAAVTRELERQLERFRILLGRDPTHLDSHQHVHLNEPVRSVLRRAAEGIGVPLRHFSGSVRYCGDFYGQAKDGSSQLAAIATDALIGIIERLVPGITELACHPGDDRGLDSAYRDERRAELAALCDPLVRPALTTAGVQLCSFHEAASPPSHP